MRIVCINIIIIIIMLYPVVEVFREWLVGWFGWRDVREANVIMSQQH